MSPQLLSKALARASACLSTRSVSLAVNRHCPMAGSSEKCKVVVVGDANSGKTCLLSVFSKGEFLEASNYQPTLYDSDGVGYIELTFRQSCVRIGPCLNIGSLQQLVNVELSLWDTGGNEELDRFRRICYPDADVVIVCFAVDDAASMRNVIDKWAPEVRYFCNRVPLVLVATKCDLRSNRRDGSQGDFVNQQDIDKVARTIGAFAALECSAKSGEGVREVFETASKAALRARRGKSRCKLYPA